MFKKKKKKTTTKKNTSQSKPQHGTLKRKEAKKLINDSLSPKQFYGISATSQRSYEHLIEVLQISTDDYLNGNNTADLDLLIQLGLFQAIDGVFRTSHAQGHLAGGAGVIAHGQLADREKRLLAVVQRIARRSELSEKLSLQHSFLETLIFRIKYMLGSLQRYTSSSAHKDEVIADEIEDEEDEIVQRPTGRSAKSIPNNDNTPTLPTLSTVPTLPSKSKGKGKKKGKNNAQDDAVEYQIYEYHHKFFTSSSIGISIIDRATEVNAKLTKKQLKKKLKSKKQPDDKDIGIFVGSLIDYGQADNICRLPGMKGKDNRILKGDKIVEINGINASRFSSAQFVKAIKNGTEQVDMKFRGQRKIKARKSSSPIKSKKKRLSRLKQSAAIDAIPEYSPAAPTAAATGSPTPKRRGRLVHKKGSLGGGASEKGGRIRHIGNEHFLADSAVHSVDHRQIPTSLKAKGVAMLWVIPTVSQRRTIVKGVDLLDRISFHLNALNVLLDTKVVRSFLIKSSSSRGGLKELVGSMSQGTTMLDAILHSTLDMLLLFEKYTHSNEQFVFVPLIRILYRISGGDPTKKETNTDKLKNWKNVHNSSSTNAPISFTTAFMYKKGLWKTWVNAMSRSGKKQSNMTNETLSMMMHILYVTITKGKYKTRHLRQVGVYFFGIAVDMLNTRQKELLGNEKNKGTDITTWESDRTKSQNRNIKTFIMLTTTLNEFLQDDVLRGSIFSACFKPPGLSSLWLTLYETIFDVTCCEQILSVLHIILIDSETGELRVS